MWLPAGIAVFAFNRPEVMNAMSRKLVMQVSSKVPSIHALYVYLTCACPDVHVSFSLTPPPPPPPHLSPSLCLVDMDVCVVGCWDSASEV